MSWRTEAGVSMSNSEGSVILSEHLSCVYLVRRVGVCLCVREWAWVRERLMVHLCTAQLATCIQQDVGSDSV